MMRKRLLSAVVALSCLAATACNGNQTTTDTASDTTAAVTEEGNAVKADYDISDTYDWGNVEIVGGGYTVGIYYNSTEEGLIYARTDIGGAYRMSKDTGRWIPLTDEFNNDNYTCYGIDGLATDEQEPNRVYLLAGMYSGWNAYLLRSEDYGETWEQTPLEFSCGGNEPNRFADRLMLDPNDNKTLYIGSRSSGLWVSHDYGATFAKVDSFPTLGMEYTEDGYKFGITAIAFDTASSEKGSPCQTIIVGTGDKASYISKDGGATWAPVEGEPKTYLAYHIEINGDNAFFTYGGKAGPYQVGSGAIKKYSMTSGEWTDITPVPKSGHGWGDLAIDKNNTDIMYASTMGKWGGEENDCIYRTTDGGATWTALFEGDGQDKIFSVDYSGAPWLTWGGDHAKLGWMMGCLALNPFNSDEIMYGTGATIFRSTNLTKWGTETVNFEVKCAGLEETAVLGLEAANSDDIRLYSALGDIDGFTHYDVDKVPEVLSGNGYFTSAADISCAYNNPLIAARTGSSSTEIGITTDGGKTWSYSKPNGAKGNGGSVCVNCDGTAIYWSNSTSASVFVTTDLGENWTKLEKPFANPKMATDCFNPDVFYCYYGGFMYISMDKGASFEMSTLATPDGATVTASPENEGEVYLCSTYGGVYRVTDFGKGEITRLGMQSASAFAIGAAEGEGKPMTMYAIGLCEKVSGIWRSTDSGATWQRINDDDHNFGSIGETMAADYRVFGQVYFGTNGRGIIMGRVK